MKEVRALLSSVLPADAIVAGEPTTGDRLPGDRSIATVLPTTREQVARLLELASAEGWCVVPAGCGSWMKGAPPRSGNRVELVLSTRRMESIVAYEPADLTVTAEAGVTLATIRRVTADAGQWLPLDPPPDDRGTLGATLATASCGPLAARFGAPRDLTLGLDLVAGDGRELVLGGRVVKNVAGFDLVRLAIGSGGTLGIITRATLRVYPLPDADLTMVLDTRDGSEATAAARGVATGAGDVTAIEILDPGVGVGPSVIVRVVGSVPEVEAVADAVERASGISGWRRLTDGAADGARQQARSMDSEAALTARLSMLPARLATARSLLDGLRKRCSDAGHDWGLASVSDPITGGTRVAVTGLGGQPGQVVPFLERLRAEAQEAGGAFRVTRAPASVWEGFERPPAGADPTRRLIRGIRERFDPSGVLPTESGW
jgi:FAD/FMN-containing dehydrogenase